ncbi:MULTISPECIES: hypothetical protein [Micromonospora]|nr:hypothetical protein [Micromonospora terminaliae]
MYASSAATCLWSPAEPYRALLTELAGSDDVLGVVTPPVYLQIGR